MPNKNIDGIKKVKTSEIKVLASKPKQLLKVDSIISQKKTTPRIVKKQFPFRPNYIVPFKKWQKSSQSGNFFYRVASQIKVPITLAVLALLLAFSGGMWTALSTPKISANNQPEVLGAFTDQPSSSAQQSTGALLAGTQLQNQNSQSISENILFNTPIEYLQNYLTAIAQPDIIEQRTKELQAFLAEKKSPLTSAASTIAEQTHWQFIVAIAFAESSLGKNCADNNCSNIGSRPGAPTWRQYSSYQAWVIDFNHLLDKKYKDQTLEQMCGVYVQPCNPNWLLATQEILTDFKNQGIE